MQQDDPRQLMRNPEFKKLWEMKKRLQKKELADRKKNWEVEQAWKEKSKR